MKFIDFLYKHRQFIISVIFFFDFSITSWIWIASSPILNAIDKINHILTMVIFCSLPWGFQLMIKDITFRRKESGNNSNLKNILEKRKKFTELFNFFYIILVFSLTRVIDSLEFNELSYFALRLIFAITINIFFVIVLYLKTTEYKKTKIGIALIISNSLFILSFSWVKISYEPPEHLQQIIGGFILGIILGILSGILVKIFYWKKEKKRKIQSENQ